MKNKFIPVCNAYLNGNEKKYLLDCINTGWISSAGKYVKEFEQAFARYCGCKYAVAVSNGTAALHIALVTLGIKKGDEVIVPSFTMIACAFAICYTGANPVFVEADKSTFNIDVKKIEEKITARTKAIIATISRIGELLSTTTTSDPTSSYEKVDNTIIPIEKKRCL